MSSAPVHVPVLPASATGLLSELSMWYEQIEGGRTPHQTITLKADSLEQLGQVLLSYLLHLHRPNVQGAKAWNRPQGVRQFTKFSIKNYTTSSARFYGAYVGIGMQLLMY